MKKFFIVLLVIALLAALCACGAAQKSEQPAAETAAETTGQPAAEATSQPAADPNAAPTEESTPEPTVEPVNPYAWLGYKELPACAYFDAIASQVFYREYDMYALGYVSHAVEATDGVNVYSFDDLSGNLALILDGEAYSLNANSMIYLYRDMRDTYADTLEQKAQQREQGIDPNGKAYKGTGSEPIPLYCDEGDAASYDYYAFFTDGQYPMTEHIYYKDGDAFAKYTSIATGEDTTMETTEVITAYNASPNPALFALPDNFDEYTLYE